MREATGLIPIIYDNLWAVGLGLVALSWLIGNGRGDHYTGIVIFGYILGFTAISWNMLATQPLEMEWLNWLLGGIAGMLGFGAFLETRKPK